MNAAVMTTKNEEDIVGDCLAHIFREGIDRVYVADASTDGTRAILRKFGKVHMVYDQGKYTNQAGWTDRLTALAGTDGADWILPLDADEFPRSVQGGTVADALWECGARLLSIDVFDHLDRERRYLEPRHQKVAFRYQWGAKVGVGAHHVTLHSNPVPVSGVLEYHEWCYRSFDHFLAKSRQRIEDLSPEYREMGWGGHHARLEGWSDAEMAEEWERLIKRPLMMDPLVPGSSPPPPVAVPASWRAL